MGTAAMAKAKVANAKVRKNHVPSSQVEFSKEFLYSRHFKRILPWVKAHPELWRDIRGMACQARAEGIYSSKTGLGDTIFALQKYVRYLKSLGG